MPSANAGGIFFLCRGQQTKKEIYVRVRDLRDKSVSFIGCFFLLELLAEILNFSMRRLSWRRSMPRIRAAATQAGES